MRYLRQVQVQAQGAACTHARLHARPCAYVCAHVCRTDPGRAPSVIPPPPPGGPSRPFRAPTLPHLLCHAPQPPLPHPPVVPHGYRLHHHLAVHPLDGQLEVQPHAAERRHGGRHAHAVRAAAAHHHDVLKAQPPQVGNGLGGRRRAGGRRRVGGQEAGCGWAGGAGARGVMAHTLQPFLMFLTYQCILTPAAGAVRAWAPSSGSGARAVHIWILPHAARPEHPPFPHGQSPPPKRLSAPPPVHPCLCAPAVAAACVSSRWP